MANSIALFKQYVPYLDEVYKEASLSEDLDGAPELVTAGANANELVIPKMSLQGQADYSRSTGYVNGDVTLTNETVVCNYDRGRKFSVDVMDDIETAGIAFGRLSSEYIRTKYVPEVDAFRFATYAQAAAATTYHDGTTAKVSTAKSEDLTTGAAVVTALRACINAMDEAEVPQENRILYITPSLLALVEDMDTTKSRAVLEGWTKIVKVPQTRFYSKIEMSSTGNGGYVKDSTDGKNLNFLAVHKDAIIQFPKHSVSKVITPEANQDSDGWIFGFRTVGIADYYDNKAAGIYASVATN